MSGSPRTLPLMISDSANTGAFCPSPQSTSASPWPCLVPSPTLSDTSLRFFSLVLSPAFHHWQCLLTSDQPSFPTFPRFPTPSADMPVVCTLALIVEICLNDHSADWTIHVHTPCSSLSINPSSSHNTSIKYHNYRRILPRPGALGPVEVSSHHPSISTI